MHFRTTEISRLRNEMGFALQSGWYYKVMMSSILTNPNPILSASRQQEPWLCPAKIDLISEQGSIRKVEAETYRNLTLLPTRPCICGLAERNVCLNAFPSTTANHDHDRDRILSAFNPN